MKFNKKTIKDIDLNNKKVIIRVDFNVPIIEGKITSSKRIKAALPTIQYAIDNNASIILLSHLGRVKTEEDKVKRTLKPVALELEKILGKKIDFVPFTRGKEVEEKAKNLKSGNIIMLENTRFEDLNNKAESKNDPELGKYWASLGDIFINDAFGTAHRAHASNVGISKNISQSAIGLLIEEELMNLEKALDPSLKPSVAIIGGAKVSDKIELINNLLSKVDKTILGGALANTFLAAKGIETGSSLIDKEYIDMAKSFLEKYNSGSEDRIILPLDNNLSKTFADTTPFYNKEDPIQTPEGYMALDIGPKTIKYYEGILSKAKAIIWNGPLGVTEFKNYVKGTEAIAKKIATLPKTFSVVGGGDSAAAIESLKLESSFSHISTGGGAALTFYEGKSLPGIDSIEDKNN